MLDASEAGNHPEAAVVGHVPWLEDPEGLRALLRQFLANVAGA